MPRITSASELNDGVEIIFDQAALTVQLVATGNLDAADGVDWAAVYTKAEQLWNTSVYNDMPFPFAGGNQKAGDYRVGQNDVGEFSAWTFADDTTRGLLRNGGWDEFDASGNLLRRYACFVGRGTINAGAQCYYQLDAVDAPTNFINVNQFNQGVQVFGNASNGNFDKQTFAKTYVREPGFLFASSTLDDTEATIGPDITSFLISNRVDDKVVANDAAVTSTAVYQGVTIEWFDTPQSYPVGNSGSFPFTVRIRNANGASLEEIYTKHQYLFRQATDINSNAATADRIGQITDTLIRFDGDNLIAEQGVYIENVLTEDRARTFLTDENGVARPFPSVSGGTITASTNLTTGGTDVGTYAMFFESPVAGPDFGEDGAIIVNDASGNPITGDINAVVTAWDFDFSGNTQAGYTGGTDRPVVVMGIRPGSAKYTVGRGTITNSTSINIVLQAQSTTIAAP